MKSNVKSGQSQLLIPFLIIITSAIVFATNTTLNISNETVTGNFVGTVGNIGTPVTIHTQEFTFPIEVWANTTLDIRVEGGLVKSSLLIDNGVLIENQPIDFYLNDTPLYSDLTGPDGIDFPIPHNGFLRAVFNGDDEMFLHPSEFVFSLNVGNETEDVVFEVLSLEQGGIEIGEPVKWKKTLRVFNPNNEDALADFELEFPEDSFNTSVFEKDTKKLLSLLKKWLKSKEAGEYYLEYYTNSPVVIEHMISRHRKRINISSPIHYENVSVYTEIEESPIEAVKLYWIVDGEKIDVTNDPSFNVILIDSNSNGLIDRVEWIVPHLSDQIFEVSIIILNPYTYLRDGENWVVAFNTTGVANLTINSTNAGWTEFLTDDSETFDEMRFFDIKCGDNSITTSLQLIDFSGNIYNYSDLTENDSIEIEHLFIQNYSCDETGYIFNNMIKAGYATLQFTFGDQTAFAYDAATVCVWRTDTVNWAESQGGGGSAWGVANTTWDLGTNCSAAGGPTSGCYIANISINMYGASASPASDGLAFIIFSNNSTTFYPLAIDVGGEYTYGPVDSCGYANNYSGPGYPGDPASTPNTCNLSSTDWFNVTSYLVNWFIPGKGSVSIPTISYQWCWEDAFPKLDNPLVNATESGFSAGWGSAFNFSVQLWEPQGNETNLTLWYTQTAGTDWLFAASKNDTSPPTVPPGNMNNFSINFSCSAGTITDGLSNDLGVVGAAKYYKFNATDPYGNGNDTETYYENIYFIPIKDNISLSNGLANNTLINRTGGRINISRRAEDNIRKVYLTEDEISGTLYVQRDGSIFNSYGITGSNATGHLAYELNPTCGESYEPGPQLWYITSGGSACYYGNESQNLTLIIYGNISATIEEPTGTVEYNRGDIITIKGYLENDCGAAQTGWSDKINVTLYAGSNTYYCGPIQDVGGEPGNYSCDWDSSGGIAGNYIININTSNGYYYNSTYNETDAFSLVTAPKVNDPAVTPSTGGWGIEYNYTIDIDDATGEEVNVSLWLDPPTGDWQYQNHTTCIAGTNCTQVWFAKNYTCDDQGTWFFRFNASDNYATKNATAGTHNHLMGKDNVTVEYVSGNNTIASLDTPALFIFEICDWEKGTCNISAPVNFNITKQGSGTQYYMMGTNTTNETGHVKFYFYADPTFDTGDQNWSVHVNTTQSPQCYDYNFSTIYLNVTTSSNVPKIDTENVDPITGGWGDSRRFNVSVYDGNDNVNVSLWRSTLPSGAEWIYVDSKTYTNIGSWENVSFLMNFTCGNVSQGTWYYRFNATNTIGNKNSTTASTERNYTINKNNIIFEEVYGNDTTANRSGSQQSLLYVRLRDGNNTYLDSYNATFYVTTDGGTWPTTGSIVSANSTGYANYNFDPACSPKNQVGDQLWKVDVGDGCYQTNSTNTSNIYLNLTVMGNILLELTNPDGNSNVTQGNSMQFLGYTNDDCGDALTLNYTFGYEEITYYANNSSTYGFWCGNSSLIGANAYQCYWQTDLSTPTGPYNASMFVNRTYYYQNQTLENVGRDWLFYVLPFREFRNISIVPSSALWDYQNWNFSVIATSGDYNNETIKLKLRQAAGAWQDCEDATQCSNFTLTECTHCINQTYFWLANFTSDDTGTWFFKFEMNNSNTYEIDLDTDGTDSFNVLSSSVRIFLENVTQNPSSASWGDGNFTFNVTVNTTGTYNVTVFLWTGNDSSGPWSLVGQENYSITGDDWQQLNFSNRYDCGDIGNNFFFFNATNYNGTTNETSSQSFTVTKDRILFEYAEGHGSTANRSEDQITLLSFQIEDTNGTTLTSFPIKYRVTTNNVSYYTDENFTINTDADGFANYSFNATCSGEYSGAPKFGVGEQQWRAEVNDSELECYYQNY